MKMFVIVVVFCDLCLLLLFFQSNTFQVVLAGNDKHTFAIFNYYKMEIPFTEYQLVRREVCLPFLCSFLH